MLTLQEKLQYLETETKLNSEKNFEPNNLFSFLKRDLVQFLSKLAKSSDDKLALIPLLNSTDYQTMKCRNDVELAEGGEIIEH
jgi:hypothetical protein